MLPVMLPVLYGKSYLNAMGFPIGQEESSKLLFEAVIPHSVKVGSYSARMIIQIDGVIVYGQHLVMDSAEVVLSS